jgi:hypothetical protein
MSYAAPEGALNTPASVCDEAMCLARQSQFGYGEYEDPDTQYYATKSVGSALLDATMAPGSIYDVSRNAKYRKIFTLGRHNKPKEGMSVVWSELRSALVQVTVSWFLDCKRGGRVSMDTEGFTTRALRAYALKYKLTKEEQLNSFAVLHLCSPKGVMLQIRCMYDGRKCHGQEIPAEVKDVLRAKGIRKMGFGIDTDVNKLNSMPDVRVRSFCNLHSIVLMLWPQTDVKNPKIGKWFVKKQLQAPCGLYHKLEDKPETGGVCVKYEEMDFTKCVDEWDDVWCWYNYLDHALAYALMDYASARAADLDGLSTHADIIRYTLDLLDCIRDLPPGYRNPGRGFAVTKTESNEERARIYCWPLVKDYDIYNRYYVRVSFENSLTRKHRLDPEHFTHTYREFLELAMDAKMENWNKLSRVGHKDWFIMEGINFPHPCRSCGSFSHGEEACTSEESCKYPFCLSNTHEISVCPMVTHRCETCMGLGHSGHGEYSITSTREHFNAARHLHLVASRLRNRDVAFVVKTNQSGRMEVVEETSLVMLD